jgi:3-dehydroquinate synthase
MAEKTNVKRLDVEYNGEFCYPVLFSKDYSGLADEVAALKPEGRKVCIVTDSNVAPHYLDKVKDILEKYYAKVITYTFPAGEQSKTLDVVTDILENLIENGFDRNDMLAALGGGVTGDMTGFAASIYLRGIKFFQLPTTLLSMVDASVGGKTGVDFKSYKNMVGAFYMPSFVYINIDTLNTLTDKVYFEGYGEIIKHAYIKDAELLDFLEENVDELKKRNPKLLLKLVYRNVKIKRYVVQKDPKESGLRAILNFGHTLGHAIEKQSDLRMLHGECVSVGCMAALYMSYKRGFITEKEVARAEKLFKMFELPVNIKLEDGFEPDKIIADTKKDKKKDGAGIKFVLINREGNAIIDKSVSDDEMRVGLDFVLVK